MRGGASPPRLAERLIERVLGTTVARHGVLGDLEEEYRRRRARRSRIACSAWYWAQAFAIWWRFGRERGTRWPELGGLWTDLRVTGRGMRKRPGFAAVVLLTLGLGIGGATTMFALVHNILIDPLPYADADRLVAIWPEQWASHELLSGVEAHLAEGRLRSFEAIGAFAPHVHVMQDVDGARELAGPRVSAGFLEVLRPDLQLGRTFDPGEDRQGSDDVVILTDGLWRSRFAADPGVIGTSIHIRGAERTVVGVLPPGFDVLQAGAQVVVPQAISPSDPSASQELKLIGRLRPGTSLEQANSEFVAYATSLAEQLGVPSDWSQGAELVPLREWLVGDVRATLMLLFAASGLLLAIAGANVAGLFVARALGRRAEMAVRAALGAGRGQTLRLLWTETTLLGLTGAAVGVASAAAALPALGAVLTSLAPESIYNVGTAGLPRLGEAALNGAVLLFSGALGLVAGLAAGAVPAFRRSGASLTSALGTRAAAGGSGPTGARARRVLVSAEIALAVVLLSSTGVLAKSLWRLGNVDPGFRPQGLLAFSVAPDRDRWSAGEELSAAFERLDGSLEALPRVEGVATVSDLPLSPTSKVSSSYRLDLPPPDPGTAPITQWRSISPDYFDVVGIPVMEGRGFESTDGGTAEDVVVVSQSAARALFSGDEPVGRSIRVGLESIDAAVVVGVVGDVGGASSGQSGPPLIYRPWDQADAVLERFGFLGRGFVIRVDGDPYAVAAAVGPLTRDMDPRSLVRELRSMSDALASTRSRPRALLALITAFAALAVALAAVGVFGVVSHVVRQRAREMGIRVALGATRVELYKEVLAEGLRIGAIGLVSGVGLSLLSLRALRGFVFDVGVFDPAVLLAACAVAGSMALVACVIPAWRAGRVDPVGVLAG